MCSDMWREGISTYVPTYQVIWIYISYINSVCTHTYIWHIYILRAYAHAKSIYTSIKSTCVYITYMCNIHFLMSYITYIYVFVETHVQGERKSIDFVKNRS